VSAELADGDVLLTPIAPTLARRILDRDERPGDLWHPDYPFADERGPLAALARSVPSDSPFTMYAIRMPSTRVAVGGFGFFGPPDETGTVEFGYGLVGSARGRGLATAAVRLALRHAQQWGAHRAVADTEADNLASRRVLAKAGLHETGRRGTLVVFEQMLG
jgi:RimJ/RimL family protein N-acetyltransferase